MMSLSKLNYDSLQEEFCYWYFKVNKKFPDKDTVFSKAKYIKLIWALRRSYKYYQQKELQNETHAMASN